MDLIQVMVRALVHALGRRCRATLVAIAGVLVVVAPWSARAEMRALLVGVSGYPERPLDGPRNDVRRMRELLGQRGFDPTRITTLADGLAGAGEPTRAGILHALDQLAERSSAGDFAFIYFSGHGSQQPADPTTPHGRAEADGLHETFLPLDIGRWDGRKGTVQNAIVDHELRDKVDRILARGAFVWAVFDACHSASLVRGAPDEGARHRRVDPLDLGVPPTAMSRATAQGASSADTTPVLGRAGGDASDAVYFYAAQTTELTPELSLPLGERDREKQGLFGFVLRQALASGRPMTYRQLGQIVLARYAGMNVTHTTPVFAGTALDRVVFGQQTHAVRQWPISPERMTVPVGTLSGLAEGARFAIVPDPAADASQSLGTLHAVQVGLNHADLAPLASDPRPAPDAARLPPRAHARLQDSPERYALRVALDERACRSCRWRAALDTVRSQGVPGAQVEWVDRDGELNLHVGEHELVGLPVDRTTRGACEPGRRPCDERALGTVLLSSADGGDPTQLAQRLASRLHRVARAVSLARLAARAAVPDAPATPGLEAAVAVQPKGTGPAARRPARADAMTRAQAGDQLVVTLDNRGRAPTDVTLLYLDARHGASVLFPREGDVNRLEPGATLRIDDITLDDNGGVFGIERLLVIAVESERQRERADFSFLAQSPLRMTSIRGAALDDDMGALFDAAFPGLRGRGEPPRAPGRRTRMAMFGIDLVPPGKPTAPPPAAPRTAAPSPSPRP